jgi:hypothetical protein
VGRAYGTAKTELNEIARDGAVAQRNSGRGKTAKGDAVIDGTWLVDYKETAKSFTLSMAVWAKICTDAIKSGNLQPTLKVILGADTRNKVRLFVISEDDMIEYRRLRLLFAENSSTMER